MISKVFEICMHRKICNNLNVSGLQFGFVKEIGSDKSLFTVTKVVNYFLKRHSNVFVVTLDAYDAFDNVNVYGLITKLIDRYMSFDVVRVLLSWYVNTRACVRLNGYCTEYIDMKSEGKQGGIMSPMLYKIYVDNLVKKLMCEKLGCVIGDCFFGTVFYADDIVLLEALVCKIQKMINLCCEYGKKYGICFNPKKTKWLCTNAYNKHLYVNFLLNNNVIENSSNSIRYLGINLIVKRGLLTVDVNDRIGKCNALAYDVLMNSADLFEVVRCQLIIN